ncbi:hypothetical protein ACFO3I_14330 [Rheinheimera marina]|uniref:Uncharacterized protein n=1 Tax=Rheinheimera marina TaxID=1774958 RepID=A0ABV9JPU5_9GAMM
MSDQPDPQPAESAQQLLQQAMALFDMAPVQQVQLAFPSVISATAPPPDALQLNLHQLYASQEQLFTADLAGATPDQQPQTVEPAVEPDSVRQMFEPAADS